MVLTALQCLGQVRHTLAGEPDPLIAGFMVLNHAGQCLLDMHPWRWTERVGSTLDLTASTSYVALPSDFRELMALGYAAGTYGSFIPVSFDALLQLRQTSTAYSSTCYWYAISYALDANNVPLPRLEIYPTPSASATAAWTIVYRAGWTRITNDSDTIRIPEWLEPLYIALVRATARGYEEEDQGDLNERLVSLMEGPLFRMAIERDIGIQTQHGPIEQTAASDVQSWTGTGQQYLGLVSF